MTDAELVKLAVQMRQAQRTYFRTRDRADLMKSKAFEAAFDKAAGARHSEQSNLFDRNQQ